MKLIQEIDEYYEKEISKEKSQQCLEELGNSIKMINNLDPVENIQEKTEIKVDESKMISFARQSTPKELKETAARYNFNFCQYWGVHPHMLLPKLNRKLPLRFFNILSDALCVFENEDISLIWSSVFIGKFEYGL